MDAPALLDAPARQVAARILAAWEAARALEDRHPDTLRALASARAGDDAAWRRAAQLVASDARGRLELDAVPGLRTRVWQDAVGGTLPAITCLLSERARLRAGDGELIQLRDARIWVPDTALPELAYHLELDARGIGLGWDCDGARDRACADLAEHAAASVGGADGGLARLWRRWSRWASTGAAAPVRAWLAHPGVVGSIPATGLDARAPQLAAFARACVSAAPAAPIVARGAAVLLGWCRARVPRARQLAALSEAPAHRHLRAGATRAGLRAGLHSDPVVALPAALAPHGQQEPLPALVAALRAGLRVALADAQVDAQVEARAGAGPSAPWPVTLTHSPPLPPFALCAQAGRLLIDGQGIATLAAWLGWFPLAYARQAGGQWTWPWAALEACGWSALEASGAWTRVRAPGRAGARCGGPWFACGPAAAALPRSPGWPAPLAAAGGDAASMGAIPDLLRWIA